jgi:hydrogenase maturation protein HypF
MGILFELYGEEAAELGRKRGWRQSDGLVRMLSRDLNAVRTSSMGRLFDAVAALLGLRACCDFEGQAAMELEFAIGDTVTDGTYPMPVDGHGSMDWAPMIRAILEDVEMDVPRDVVACRFHNALVDALECVAKEVGEIEVVLTGGCFQNRCLTERAIERLQRHGFKPHWHRQIPPNDGGLAVGQIVAARSQLSTLNPQPTNVPRGSR